MEIKEKKRDYQKPSMKVFEMGRHSQLLVGSGSRASLSGAGVSESADDYSEW